MENILHWAEEHPWLAGGLTLGAIFILLWLLGFFGSSSSSTSSNGSNLAAAYYNAEAAQTTAGTQLQMATVAYGAQTAQTQTQANAAVAIAQAQAGAATTINGQNASAATNINASNDATTGTLAWDSLLSSNHSADDALAAVENTNYYTNATANTQAMYGYNTTVSNNLAGEFNNFLTNVVPAELKNVGPGAVITSGGPWGNFGLAGSGGITTPQGLESVGYTPAGAAQLLGVPYPGYTT